MRAFNSIPKFPSVHNTCLYSECNSYHPNGGCNLGLAPTYCKTFEHRGFKRVQELVSLGIKSLEGTEQE